jgi:hypothetical protein
MPLRSGSGSQLIRKLGRSGAEDSASTWHFHHPTSRRDRVAREPRRYRAGESLAEITEVAQSAMHDPERECLRF